jgi:hypothetical protein
VSAAPSLTFRAIAVLSGAIAFPCVAAEVSNSADLPSWPAAVVAPEHVIEHDLTKRAATGPDETVGSNPEESVEAIDPTLPTLPTLPTSPTSPDTPSLPVTPPEPLPSLASPHDLIAPEANESDPSGSDAGGASEGLDTGCLSRTICAIKQKIRWQAPAWTSAQCQTIATAVQTSAKRHDISPTLLLAIMISESDMNEKAARVTMRGNRIYAKDSGLMAIRCILDRRNRCLNGNVRGMKLTEVMNPTTNIDLGARELAYWRDGGVSRTTLWKRNASGHVGTVTKKVRCRHKDHAFWAHYNHGPFYIAHGYPRHYPHRVAVIDHSLATVMNLDPPELHGGHITIHDAGKRERTIDRPLEPRYRKLCTQIQSVGTCSPVAYN